jgi:hypothetical protein
LFDLHSRRCSGRQFSRTDAGSGHQENLRDANANSASEKENYNCDEKEIADSNTIANVVAFGIAKEEESFADAGRIAFSKSKEEKSFTLAESNGIAFATSQEKRFANTSAI